MLWDESLYYHRLNGRAQALMSSGVPGAPRARCSSFRRRVREGCRAPLRSGPGARPRSPPCSRVVAESPAASGPVPRPVPAPPQALRAEPSPKPRGCRGRPAAPRGPGGPAFSIRGPIGSRLKVRKFSGNKCHKRPPT